MRKRSRMQVMLAILSATIAIAVTAPFCGAQDLGAMDRRSLENSITDLESKERSFEQYYIDDPDHVIITDERLRAVPLPNKDFLAWAQTQYYYKLKRRDTAGFRDYLRNLRDFSDGLKQTYAAQREEIRTQLNVLRQRLASETGVVECGPKVDDTVRRKLWDELATRSKTAWSKRRPRSHTIYNGLRDHIMKADYYTLHYSANVDIWKRRFKCFDACIMATSPKFEVDEADQSAYRGCLKTCEAIRYIRCP